MRTITLELLRHGQAHGQLLSPLTQYLALCENHSAVSLRLTFEHNQFLHRLRALGYELGEEARKFQLRDTAMELRDLLAQVPGMVAELCRERSDGEVMKGARTKHNGQELTHLRLVISSSELALLPFELALAPHGYPGAGQYLLLQSQRPICLTRETRRVPEQVLRWPDKPRILFVAASPPSVGSIPVESHVLALRKLIDPWVQHWETEDERRKAIEEHLVFLPDATAAAIETACAEGAFTHVHILAHGVQYMEGYDVRYGLALHSSRNSDGPADIVTGERLATILRAAERPASEGLSRPIVVTLASCHSGNVGTVVGMGASVAHALHEAGIPMVVAGQFPLSFEGSVLLVEVLYEGLLWGEDPRVSLNDLRRRLHSQYPSAHDWASLSAYASLPPEFDQWLNNTQVAQALRGIEVAVKVADTWLFAPYKPRRRRDLPANEQIEQLARFERIRSKVDSAMRRLEGLLGRVEGRDSRIYGQLGSAAKRLAHVYDVYGEIHEDDEAAKPEYVQGFLQSLLKARRYYWMAFESDSRSTWGIVQYLSLDIVIKRLLPRKGLVTPIHGDGVHNDPASLWSLANVQSLNSLRSGDRTRVMWTLTDLIELYLLGVLIDEIAARYPAGEMEAWAIRYTEEFIQIAGETSTAAYTTQRQILRYTNWFRRIASIDAVIGPAKQILKKFHQVEEADLN